MSVRAAVQAKLAPVPAVLAAAARALGSEGEITPEARSRMIAGTRSALMTVASRMIPAARPMPNCLMSVPGLSESTKKANISTSAALVTSFPVRASPREGGGLLMEARLPVATPA